jgi:hypothetical protein
MAELLLRKEFLRVESPLNSVNEPSGLRKNSYLMHHGGISRKAHNLTKSGWVETVEEANFTGESP